MNTHHPLLPGGRDPERLLRETVDDWDGGDAWIFGYASLIWRPAEGGDACSSPPRIGRCPQNQSHPGTS